jgi:hypothetical protein
MKLVAFSIFSSNAADLPPFLPVYGFFGASVVELKSQFYLDETKHILLPPNQVDLSKRPAIFTRDNSVTLFSQVMVGKYLACVPLAQGRRW